MADNSEIEEIEELDDKRILKICRSKDLEESIGNIERWKLLPAFFRVKGKPFSLVGREQFSVLFSDDMPRELIVMSGRQLGKCEKCTKKDDPLALRNGFGLRVDTTFDNPLISSVASEIGSVSTSGNVSCYMSPGVKKIIEIKTSLGRRIQVSEEHKVRTFFGYERAGDLHVGSRIMSLRKCYSFGNMMESEYRIALTAYLIGDGCCGLGCKMLEITGVGEIVDHIRRLCKEEEIKVTPYNKSSKVFHVRFRKKSSIWRFIENDGNLLKYSYQKSLPDWVFSLDRDCTKMFLECLWATDGSVRQDKRGFACIEYCTTSELLASDVRALLSKFGIATHMRVKKSGYRGDDGSYHRCRDAYIIRIYGYRSQKIFLETFNVPGKPSFRIHSSESGQDDRGNRDTLPAEANILIERLASYLDDPSRPGKMIRGKSLKSISKKYGGELRRRPRYHVSRFKLSKYLESFRSLGLSGKEEYRLLKEFLEGEAIYDKVVSIREIGIHDTFDIEVGKYHNFISDNICVHNSMSLSRSEMLNMLMLDNFQILYIAPLQEQSRIYSDLYMNETIQSCPLAQKYQSSNMYGKISDAKIIKSTGHQSFANGSGIQLTYAKSSADRVRGRTADQVDFDEVQDQSPDVIPIIQESLTSSEFGCSRYTGTAKVTENLIEAKWQKSSQCEWVMKCQGCGYWNIPTLEGKVLSMIKSDGMHCVHCGKRIDVSGGQWVAGYPDRMKRFRGYHIPQVVCPFIVDNPNNWDKLLHKLMNGVLATFIQENLGISYSVGQRLITMQHIRRQCVLPDTKVLQEEIKRNPARYSFIVAGIDWGGAELTSFTVITVIGIRPTGRIDVIWARRYRGFDPDEQMADIAHIVKYYSCICVFADAGMGLDKNQILAKRFGLPIVQMMYTRQLKLFGKNSSTGRTNVVKCWTIDKVMALDVLFLAIRNRRIFFPKEEIFIERFCSDLISPYESTTEVGGMSHRIYLRSEAQPDDFCHALCFACMGAMKLLGLAVDDMIPAEAFGGGRTDDTPPENDWLSTQET